MKTNILLALSCMLLLTHKSIAQTGILANPKNQNLVLKKVQDQELLVPLEIDFVNASPNPIQATIQIMIDNNAPEQISRLVPNDFSNTTIINNNQILSIKSAESVKAPSLFYLRIAKAVDLKTDKNLTLRILDGSIEISTINISLQPGTLTYTQTRYFDINAVPNVKLTSVVKVESAENVLTVSGFQDITENGYTSSVYVKRNIALKKNEAFVLSEWSFFKGKNLSSIPISLTTIPFKIRPAIVVNSSENKTNEINSVASTGITNVGFNVDIFKYQRDHYFSNAKKTAHKFSIGFWAAPSVEELSPATTNNFLTEGTSKQLFVSTALTFSYSFNDLSFVFTPIAFDYGTTTLGKNWIYNKQRWWGFGLGITPKIFSSLLNK
ncbi:hypothetical protein EZ456_01020 [Pedobacter psychrodurus]|uniref:Uncharacterized protein n=1 Tax=Pedobacter psychrodurus TaxID=2530456 RepID=A0A4R0Q1B9_9SPHI|nr:hypothetical protein [Pedobacter psychrodurus]TCD29629.1 hypothetical protein EZ456_01020 [Pedobacter psychrodurus]